MPQDTYIDVPSEPQPQSSKAAINGFRAFLSLEQDKIFRHQIQPKLLITDECWIFRGSKDRKGYGLLRIGGRKGRTVRVHRWMWEAINGPMLHERVSDQNTKSI